MPTLSTSLLCWLQVDGDRVPGPSTQRQQLQGNREAVRGGEVGARVCYLLVQDLLAEGHNRTMPTFSATLSTAMGIDCKPLDPGCSNVLVRSDDGAIGPLEDNGHVAAVDPRSIVLVTMNYW